MPWIAAGFFWFVVAAVHVVVDPAGFDISLLPRLSVLLGGLAVILAAVIVTRSRQAAAGEAHAAAGHAFDTGPLHEPLVGWWAMSTASVWLSLAWAFNPTAGLADAFKSAATLVVLCLTCLLLRMLPRWREQLPLMAGCGALAVVGVCLSEILAARAALPAGAVLPDRRFMEHYVTGNQSNVNLCANLLVLLLSWCLCGLATATGARRRFAAVAAAAAAGVVGVAQSRSAFLGLAVGTATVCITALAASGRLGLSRVQRRGLLGTLVAGAGIIGGSLAVVPDDNAIARRLRSIVVDAPSAAGAPFLDGGRREIWRLTGRMIADRPLSGVGAGNFGIAVQAYYDDRIDLSRMHHNWQNPHNDFLWVFVEKGVVGIIAYAGGLAAAVLAACRVLRRATDRRDAWIACGLLGFLAAYATMSNFDFPLERVSQPVMLAVTCGVLAVLARRTRTCHAESTAMPAAAHPQARHSEARVSEARVSEARVWWPGMRWPGMLSAVITTAVLVAGMVWTGAAVVQDRRIAGIYRAMKAGRWEEMLAAARAAATPWRTIDAYFTPITYHEGYALMELGRSEEALAVLERSLDHNPNRLATLTNLGILSVRAGRFAAAEICLREVVRRYPQHPPGYVNLAGCLIDAGRPEEAADLLGAIPEEMRTEPIRRTLDQAKIAAARRSRLPDQRGVFGGGSD